MKELVTAEMTVLAGCIYQPANIAEHGIVPAMFGNEAYRQYFEAVRDSIGSDGNVILAKAAERLGGSDPAAQAEAMAQLVALLDSHVGFDFEYRVEQLREAAEKRAIDGYIDRYKAGQIGPDEMARAILKQREERPEREAKPLDVDRIYNLLFRENPTIQGDVFGDFFEKLNIGTGTLNIVSALSGTGKTSAALNILLDLTRRGLYSCVYFNLEMNEETIFRRLTAADGRVPISRIYDKRATDKEHTAVYESLQSLRDRNKFFDSTVIQGSKTPAEIGQIVARVRRQTGRHVIVFVDLLTHIKLGPGGSEREKLAAASAELHALTKDLDCTIFLLQQLNREAYQAAEIGPQHLKGTAQTVEDADTVIALTNANERLHIDEESRTQYIEVHVLKSRTSGYADSYIFELDTFTQKYSRPLRLPVWLEKD